MEQKPVEIAVRMESAMPPPTAFDLAARALQPGQALRVRVPPGTLVTDSWLRQQVPELIAEPEQP
jgi:hypothetical protein